MYVCTFVVGLTAGFVSSEIDEILYSETTNISGMAKFLLVKMSVGAIVVLGCDSV